MSNSDRAPRNRTLTLTPEDRQRLEPRLLRLSGPASVDELRDRSVCADLFLVLPFLPKGAFDLIFIDPPYNLNKDFGETAFRAMSSRDYQRWMEGWLEPMVALLRPGGTLYLCGDWKSAGAIQYALENVLTVRNRITFEREKGRGARSNWKNASEDIWFATRGDDYYFDVEAVKLRRRVLAPYRSDGQPKDWDETEAGNFRLTHPSNLWTDLTIPFWSMPENTDHPTQKPEKLLAKLILASSRAGDLILDPFAGSGTTQVVARKLGRHFTGIEINPEYCLWAERRLELAAQDSGIQGYSDGLFWERNTLAERQRAGRV